MKSKSEWYATKFELSRGRWRSNRKLVGPGSRLVSDLQVAAYERALHKHAKGRLVDLGCGNAPLAGIYQDLVDSFLWVDWPNSPHQVFEVDQFADLNVGLDFGDESFDTLLLSDVLEHVAQPEALFKELARIMRSGATLIVGVPFLYWIHEEPNDHHRFTRYKLSDFGIVNGLEVVEVKEVGGGLDT